MILDKDELTKVIAVWEDKIVKLKEYPFEDTDRTEREIYNLQCLLEEAKTAIANGGQTPWRKITREER